MLLDMRHPSGHPAHLMRFARPRPGLFAQAQAQSRSCGHLHVSVLDLQALAVPEAELEAHYADSYGIFAGAPSRVAVLHFAARRARWVAKERWHRDQEGCALPDGRYELRVPYSNTPELLMDILKYGPDVQVLAPEELRVEVVARLAAALALYHDAGRPR